MAKLKGAPHRARGPALRGRVMVDVWRGKLRVRRWPRKRGAPRSQKTLDQIEWFKQANTLAKYSAPQDQARARAMTKGTPWMPRDVQLAAMAGRLYHWVDDTGKVWYPMAARQAVSDSLDAIGQLLGQILVRNADTWTALAPGPSGHVLTSQGPSAAPVWQPGGGGGAAYTPPTASDFPAWINQENATLDKSPYGPLVLTHAAGAATQLHARVQTLAAPPRAYVLGLRVHLGTDAFYNAGLCLRDSASGRLITWVLQRRAGPIMAVAAQRFTDPTTYDSDIATQEALDLNPAFLRLLDDGSTIHFQVAVAATAWITVASAPRTAWLSNPDQVGLIINSTANPNVAVQIAAYHWNTDTP